MSAPFLKKRYRTFPERCGRYVGLGGGRAGRRTRTFSHRPTSDNEVGVQAQYSQNGHRCQEDFLFNLNTKFIAKAPFVDEKAGNGSG